MAPAVAEVKEEATHCCLFIAASFDPVSLLTSRRIIASKVP